MSCPAARSPVNAEKDQVDIEWEPQSVRFHIRPLFVEFYMINGKPSQASGRDGGLGMQIETRGL
jgi:hypothetical protein